MRKDLAVKQLRAYARENGMRFKEYAPLQWAFFKGKTKVSATKTHQEWRDILIADKVSGEIIK